MELTSSVSQLVYKNIRPQRSRKISYLTRSIHDRWITDNTGRGAEVLFPDCRKFTPCEFWGPNLSLKTGIWAVRFTYRLGVISALKFEGQYFSRATPYITSSCRDDSRCSTSWQIKREEWMGSWRGTTWRTRGYTQPRSEGDWLENNAKNDDKRCLKDEGGWRLQARDWHPASSRKYGH